MSGYITYTGKTREEIDLSLNELIDDSLTRLRQKLPLIQETAQYDILKVRLFDLNMVGEELSRINTIISNKLTQHPLPHDFTYSITSSNYHTDTTIFLSISRYTPNPDYNKYDEEGIPYNEIVAIPMNLYGQGFDTHAIHTTAQYLTPVRNIAYDNLLTYDASTNLPTYEVGFSNFSMLTAIQYLPYSIDSSENVPISIQNETYSHTALTKAHQTNMTPLIPTNVYEYYLYNADTNTPPVKVLDVTNKISAKSFVANSENGICVLVRNPANTYNSSCYYTSYWKQNNPVSPKTTFQLFWSASIGWLNDSRSTVTINGTEYKILLNVANNSV